LVDAYKKEFSFLEAEKSELKKQIAQFETSAETTISQKKTEIDALQANLLQLRAQADSAQIDLEENDRSSARIEEDSDTLYETLTRSIESLKAKGYDLKEPSADEGIAIQSKAIQSLFQDAAREIARSGSVRTTKAGFFSKDGKKVDGTVIHIGEVAAYGIADEVSGALAPAGSQKLKLWPVDAADSARALRENRRPDALQIFLYESLEKAVPEQQKKTALAVIQSGGIIAWVIVGLGALALLLVLARFAILVWTSRGSEDLIKKLIPLVSAGRLSESKSLCNRNRNGMGRVLGITVGVLDRDRAQIEDIVSEAILRETPAIERFGTAIAVFATVAPLLGLLGTVTGIISTFDVITEFGTGDPKLLSAGISEALVTTELGLMVAIPTLLVGALLSGWAQSIMANMEQSALAIVNTAKNRFGGAKATDADAEDKETASASSTTVNPQVQEAVRENVMPNEVAS
jgi:biopolymer transport protein ExbB